MPLAERNVSVFYSRYKASVPNYFRVSKLFSYAVYVFHSVPGASVLKADMRDVE
jgi:hypothetical protein